MSGVAALLRPRIQGPANRWRRSDRRARARVFVLAAFGAAFWAGIYVFLARVLHAFQEIPEIGPVLVERLLGMLLLTFFSILLFSNLVSALSAYFLAADLPLLRASPVPPARLHLARYLETLWDSSWMILAFGVPVFLAFGVTHDAGPGYYVATALVLLPFVALPTALGVTATLLLVRFFPVRRTNDVFLVLSGLAIAVLFILLRSLQPEQLVRPEAFAEFTDFLADVEAPQSPFLPTAWATDLLLGALGIGGGESPLFSFGLLLSTAAAAYVVCDWVSERLYAEGWSRAQESRHARLSKLPFWDRWLARLPLTPVARALVTKDLKTFFRDTTQWSQLVLLAALIVVYVYNFRVLPSSGAYVAQAYLTRGLGFLNLALAAFVVASVAVRFVFPGVSLEGKAFWVVKSAPIRLRSLWWSKFWMGLLPLLTLGLLLLVASDQVLEVGPEMTALSVATLAAMTAAITALGLAFGAAFPQFDYENAAKIPSSFGGAAYMVTALSFIFANVAIEAWPMFRLLRADLTGRPPSSGEWASVFLCFVAVAILDLAVLFFAARHGMQRLERLEP